MSTLDYALQGSRHLGDFVSHFLSHQDQALVAWHDTREGFVLRVLTRESAGMQINSSPSVYAVYVLSRIDDYARYPIPYTRANARLD